MTAWGGEGIEAITEEEDVGQVPKDGNKARPGRLLSSELKGGSNRLSVCKTDEKPL